MDDMRGKDVLALEDVYVECLKKMEAGSMKYGEYDPDTDTRDLVEEAIEELHDAVNYIGMMILKLKRLAK